MVEYPQHDVTYIEWLEHPQEIKSTLALLLNSLSVLCPVQFVVQMYSKVFVIWDNIHLNGNGCGAQISPCWNPEMQIISITPLHEGVHNAPVLLFPLTGTANNCRVVRKLVQVASEWNWGVQGEQKRGKNWHCGQRHWGATGNWHTILVGKWKRVRWWAEQGPKKW